MAESPDLYFHRSGPSRPGPGFPFPFDAEPVSERVDYVALFRRLWRQKLFIVAVSALVMVGTGFVVFMLPPHYVAHALLLVSTDGGGVVRVPLDQPQISGRQADPQLVATEVERLQSPALAAEVVRDLQLYERPEFDPLLKPASGWSEFVQSLAGWFPGLAQQAPVTPAAEIDETVDNFLAQLHVDVKGNSRIIDVSFDSSDPHLAASIANSVVQHYMAEASEMQAESMQQTADWLHGKIVDLQGNVQKSEDAIEQFRTSSGFYETAEGAPLALRQIQDAQTQLATVQADEATLNERLRMARASPSETAGPATPSDMSMLSALQTQMATLQQQLAEGSATLGPRNPKIIALQEQLASVRKKISSEHSATATNTVKSIANQVALAAFKEQQVAARLDKLKDSMAKTETAQVALRKLELDAEANRAVLKNFLARYTEASLGSDNAAQNPGVQVVSSAQAPRSPQRPHKSLLIMIAGFCGLFGSSFFAVLRQHANRNIFSMEELETAIGVKPLGLIPLTTAARVSPVTGTRYGSAYREAIRSIYANLFLLRGEKSKTTVLTSAFPGEGKTTLALSLAAMARLSGHRTVLIDADFFRAGASIALGLRGTAGLAEILDGKITLAQALISDQSSGIDIITPGQFSRNAGLPSIQKWTALVLGPLQQRGYKFIIIDAPPIFAVSESLLLAAHADATIIAVRWGRTARNAVQLMAKRLRDSGASLGGFVMTMVDTHQHARYGDMYDLAETAYLSKENENYYKQRPVLAPPTKPVGALRALRNWIGLRIIGLATSKFRWLPTWRWSSRNDVPPRNQEPGSARRRKALLIMDVQQDFVEAKGLYTLPRATTDRLIDKINRIAQAAKEDGAVIVYIQQEFKRPLAKLARWIALGRRLGNAACKKRLDPRVEATAGYFLSTEFANAFSNPRLDKFLRSRQVDQVVMVGIDGAVSINRTAKTALQHGYSVLFIEDAIASACGSRWQRMVEKHSAEAAFAISSQEFVERSLNRTAFPRARPAREEAVQA